MLSLPLLDKLFSWRRALILIAAAVAGLLTLMSGAGQPLDRLLHQARDSVRVHPASGEIAIVEIDARSIAALQKWPWRRSIHARAIDRLLASDAKAIAFDVDFSALSTPGEDAALAGALERAGGTVILATLRQDAGSGSNQQIDSVPAAPFAGKGFLAAVTFIPDTDGYVRHMPLGVETAGLPRPSVASLLASKSAKIGRSFPVDYAINPNSIPRFSFVDLIKGRVPRAAIAGKRILIGATAVELGDRYAVPLHGIIPGVVIQALAAETLLGASIPREWGGLLPLSLALVLILAATVRISRPGRVFLFGSSIIVLLLLPLLTESLFAISFEIASALAAFAAAGVVGGVIWAGRIYRERTFTDAATGLPNVAAIESASRIRRPAAIVVARIDRFEAIAAGLGPDATARLVRRVAERLSLANDKRIIYRIDEGSLAWLEWDEDQATIGDRFEAVIAVMRSPVDCGRMIDVALTLGIGDKPDVSAKQLVSDAGFAALQAARKGLRWQRFSAEAGEETNWHLSLLGELDAAMASGQVWNSYQPKLDISSGQVIGAEALVRWLHPVRGPIAPDDFMPLVEEHGRARDLTLHVLAQALEDAAHWDGLGWPISVAVNVSANLLGDEEFIEQVRQTIGESRIPAERVTIEVTETAAIESADKAVSTLVGWRALGVNVSIDDYGTGQSSLGYLQKLPATELKIDRSFVQGIADDRRNAIMVRSTIALAHELGMKVVAEGIETAECLAMLGEMGCDIGQGFHIGRPMSAANLAVFLGAGELRAA